MSPATITPPEANEHAPYYSRYITLVRENDAIAALERQLDEGLAVLRAIPESKVDHRYAPEKWSIKEVVGHLIDSERVFTYRATRFARNDATPLPGFDENLYVPAASFGRIPFPDLIAEWEHGRRGTILFFRGLDSAAWARRGVANDNQVSVRAIAYIIAGHGRHTMQILEDRYLEDGV